ncbi:MAG: J domain-containing protein, partial [Planctomycetes bacterium]|nr:J domain-containing protein [Planctomycetota bacterium]
AARIPSWPDGIDSTVTSGYLALAFGLAALGYVCMVLDIRAYLRSLRRALVVIAGYRTELPEWVRKDTPRCILALGLTLPCTADDVLAAYRRKVKQLHPDRGDRRDFLRLQAQFEQAMALLANK